MNSKKKSLVKCLNQYFAESGRKRLKTEHYFIGINAVVSSALLRTSKMGIFSLFETQQKITLVSFFCQSDINFD